MEELRYSSNSKTTPGRDPAVDRWTVNPLTITNRVRKQAGLNDSIKESEARGGHEGERSLPRKSNESLVFFSRRKDRSLFSTVTTKKEGKTFFLDGDRACQLFAQLPRGSRNGFAYETARERARVNPISSSARKIDVES